ncbi:MULTISPECIES: Lrp/AsnC family transcriptional regulator [Acidiplasma]|jgi:Lrp/AsnC family transcriptional regulator for asnA, asnC and gidA|uniref:Transcriptional regulator n=2 Tax=Acidiplasma TaxID=507753 RepID=A0A0Q0S0S3_9ARCH|nr:MULTISPECIES: Lrp/AsnC family transcriptional regulator [Acidiplasma]KJE48807.1 transcriptional regulator [Acidiplasma sp. MBA-1]KPV47355.1 transcriptional regulator [Acidiplasma aeolicum]KQB36520.1 transcriptional regulator [Acidiplasma aeolicum]KQB36597.1 transcriptional regulator [Acidiplasma cupricumulans]WMT54198.1 MAG: Lrp/AsnC family transcriptional regulator [Acidiplasma sp.]
MTEEKNIDKNDGKNYECDLSIRWSKIDASILPFDELDKEIMCFLRYNARMSNAEIAKMLNTSEATVRRRINELVRKKIITGFSALVDLHSIENSIKVCIRIDTEAEKLDEIAEDIANEPDVLSLYRRRGQNQLLLQGLFLNLEAIQEFEDKLATKPGVIKYDTMIVSKAFKKDPWVGI